MKITLCGSLAFIDQMNELKKQLEDAGHEVQLPPTTVTDETGKEIPVVLLHQQRRETTTTTGWIWDHKTQAIRDHNKKVEWCEAVLIVNEDKHNVAHYIGGNTLMEMGLAFHLGKKIFLLNPIPEVPYKEEIIGMQPTVINGNLLLIR
jgi:hypothetical protein